MTTASPNKEAIGTSQESGNQNVTGKWMDIHGVGVFTAGKDNSLYLATHNGLFKKITVIHLVAGWRLETTSLT